MAILVQTRLRNANYSSKDGGADSSAAQRQWHLAAISIGAALANLALSLLLVRPLGMVGVAIGTLIPTSIECLVLIMLYALRTLQVGWREAISEIFIPAFTPVLPMIIVLYLLRAVAASASFVASHSYNSFSMF